MSQPASWNQCILDVDALVNQHNATLTMCVSVANAYKPFGPDEDHVLDVWWHRNDRRVLRIGTPGSDGAVDVTLWPTTDAVLRWRVHVTNLLSLVQQQVLPSIGAV